MNIPLRVSTSLAILVVLGCSGDDVPAGTPSPDSGVQPDSASLADTGADSKPNADAAAPPTHEASSISFHDGDPRANLVDGTVLIGKAADESDVANYNLYWLSFAIKKVSLVATLPKTGADLAYPLQGSVPATAGGLMVLTSNAAGEMTTGPSTFALDNTASHYDISAGQPANSGWSPSAVLDTTNQKLLVATLDNANKNRVGLFSCNAFAVCAYTDISAGAPAESGHDPSATIDVANGKLLVATNDYSNGKKLSLFRCNLDGSGCTYSDISAGQPPSSADVPIALVDATNAKLLVVVQNTAASTIAGLYRCNLDGTGCAYVDISAGRGANSGKGPVAVIDTINQKLLVATYDSNNLYGPGLFRCNLDGTGCTYVGINVGPSLSATVEGITIDAANKKLIITQINGFLPSSPGLFRCNLDGSGCVYQALPGADMVYLQPVIDPVNNKLWVGADDASKSTGGKPAAIRCNIDGSGGMSFSVAVNQGPKSGSAAQTLYDAANKRLLMVTEDDSNSAKLSLFVVDL